MENGVVNLANGLDEKEFRLEICCLNKAGEFASRVRKRNAVRVLDKPPGFSWQAVRRLRKVFEEVQPAIVHTHNLGTLIYSVLARPRNSRLPILHGEHAEFAEVDLTLRRRVQRAVLYRQVEKIVPVSESLGEHLISHGAPADKMAAINNGVDTERFVPGNRSAAREQFGLPQEAVVLGMVGRFGPYKRHDLLIAAFEDFAKANPNVHLLLVGGGGPEEKRIRELVERSPVRCQILWAGFKPDPLSCYQAMDMLVLPSFNEGMSNAALEAMACAVPVLCHRACGHADIIHDGVNGYVRNIESAPELARILSELLARQGELRVAGRAGRDFVVQKLSWQRMREAYAELYRQTARTWKLTPTATTI
jgi:glycosyltransferase involved in cell wall biosynthesis